MHGSGTEMSFPAVVLVLVCCIVLVVPVDKVHRFVWKLVVKLGLVYGLIGMGRRMGWEKEFIPAANRRYRKLDHILTNCSF